MRVVLLKIGDITVLSYPAFIALAIAAGLASLAWRLRTSRQPQTPLLAAVLAALITGWAGSRAAVALLAGNSSAPAWSRLLPTQSSGMSFTAFGLFAAPVFLAILWTRRSHLLEHLDAVAPSTMAGLAVAKAGCLLAGCCAGAICPSLYGVTYPYGSRPYAQQVASGQIAPPPPLLLPPSEGPPRPMGHIDFLRAVQENPPPELTDLAQSHGLTFTELFETAQNERSRPVWPVPIAYAVAAAVLWIAAEIVFVRSRRTGWTLAAVLIGYALIRLTLDPFVAHPPQQSTGISLAQIVASGSLLSGLILAILCLRGKTPNKEPPKANSS